MEVVEEAEEREQAKEREAEEKETDVLLVLKPKTKSAV